MSEEAWRERVVRGHLTRGDVARAVEETTAIYGAEVFGFLTAAAGDDAAARDLYARLGDELAHELPGFAWRCSLRTFTYYLARRELRRGRARATVDTSRTRVARRRLVARAATVEAVRKSLSHDDRELLVLRFDRRFAWRDLAISRLGDRASEPAIAAEAERLRRRVVALRARITRLRAEP